MLEEIICNLRVIQYDLRMLNKDFNRDNLGIKVLIRYDVYDHIMGNIRGKVSHDVYEVYQNRKICGCDIIRVHPDEMDMPYDFKISTNTLKTLIDMAGFNTEYKRPY